MSFYPNQPPPGYIGYNPYMTHPSAQQSPFALASPLPMYPVLPISSQQGQQPPGPYSQQAVPFQTSPLIYGDPQQYGHQPLPQTRISTPTASAAGAPPASVPLAAPAAVAAAAGGAAGAVAAQTMTSGVKVDRFGIPIVPGDVNLRYVETFKVEEKALSATRDSFEVTDSSESVRYKVTGSWRMSEMKELSDVHGQILLRLREARLRMRDRITVFSPSNVPLMTLQKTEIRQRKEKKVHGYLGAQIKENPDLIITGNEDNTHFSVKNPLGSEVSIVKRKKYTIKNMLMGRDTYEVTVMAGSPAFMCFLAIALDEIYED